jgi:adenylate kinase family enzyme
LRAAVIGNSGGGKSTLARRLSSTWQCGRANRKPPTEALFRPISEVDQNWMPQIRRLVALVEQRGKRHRLNSVSDLDGFDDLS